MTSLYVLCDHDFENQVMRHYIIITTTTIVIIIIIIIIIIINNYLLLMEVHVYSDIICTLTEHSIIGEQKITSILVFRELKL